MQTLVASALYLLAAVFLNLAHAEVKMPGTILESQCGQAREKNPRLGGYVMTRVCEATITGEAKINGEATVGGAGKTYLVVQESRATRAGMEQQSTVWEITKRVPAAKGSTVEVTEIGYRDANGRYQQKVSTGFVTGKVKIQHGRANYNKMSGTIGGRQFVADKFQSIYHTM